MVPRKMSKSTLIFLHSAWGLLEHFEYNKACPFQEMLFFFLPGGARGGGVNPYPPPRSATVDLHNLPARTASVLHSACVLHFSSVKHNCTRQE